MQPGCSDAVKHNPCKSLTALTTTLTSSVPAPGPTRTSSLTRTGLPATGNVQVSSRLAAPVLPRSHWAACSREASIKIKSRAQNCAGWAACALAPGEHSFGKHWRTCCCINIGYLHEFEAAASVLDNAALRWRLAPRLCCCNGPTHPPLPLTCTELRAAGAAVWFVWLVWGCLQHMHCHLIT